MSRTAAALLLLVAQIASTNAQEECVGADSVPGVSLEWDDATVTVNNLGGFGSDGDTNAAQMLKFEDVNWKGCQTPEGCQAQNYFAEEFSPPRPTQVDLEIKTAAFKLELPIHPMSRRANDGETLTAEWAYKPKMWEKNGCLVERPATRQPAPVSAPMLTPPPARTQQIRRLRRDQHAKPGDDRRPRQGGLLPVLLQARRRERR